MAQLGAGLLTEVGCLPPRRGLAPGRLLLVLVGGVVRLEAWDDWLSWTAAMGGKPMLSR